jgi:pseudaminic acid synthase
MWIEKIRDIKKPPVLVAELSGNHNNSIVRSKELIHAAAEAGADAVKLQTFKPDTITLISDKPRYRIDKKKWGVGTLGELYGEAAMPWKWQAELKELACSLGLGFFSTPFDKTAVDFLVDIGVDAMKVASPEIVDIPLIDYVLAQGLPTVISTGGACKEDIAAVLSLVDKADHERIYVLHCIAEYPAAQKDSNLATLTEIKDSFKVSVGLSDHSIGTDSAFGATILGARIIEKHITLSRKDGGVDSHFSSEPDEFAQLRKTIDVAHGLIGVSLLSQRLPSERDVINSRRSLVALKNISVGEVFTDSNIGSRRPGGGLSPSYLKNILGKVAKMDIEFGDPIEQNHIIDQ